VTISSWLNFGRPPPPGRGSAAGRNFFGSALLQPARSVCVSLSAFLIGLFYGIVIGYSTKHISLISVVSPNLDAQLFLLFTLQLRVVYFWMLSPVRAPGCKNGPTPFPGRMSYKATKPGLVSVLYLNMFFIVLLFIRAPFYILLVFIVCVLSFGCSS